MHRVTHHPPWAPPRAHGPRPAPAPAPAPARESRPLPPRLPGMPSPARGPPPPRSPLREVPAAPCRPGGARRGGPRLRGANPQASHSPADSELLRVQRGQRQKRRGRPGSAAEGTLARPSPSEGPSWAAALIPAELMSGWRSVGQAGSLCRSTGAAAARAGARGGAGRTACGVPCGAAVVRPACRRRARRAHSTGHAVPACSVCLTRAPVQVAAGAGTGRVRRPRPAENGCKLVRQAGRVDGLNTRGNNTAG